MMSVSKSWGHIRDEVLKTYDVSVKVIGTS